MDSNKTNIKDIKQWSQTCRITIKITWDNNSSNSYSNHYCKTNNKCISNIWTWVINNRTWVINNSLWVVINKWCNNQWTIISNNNTIQINKMITYHILINSNSTNSSHSCNNSNKWTNHINSSNNQWCNKCHNKTKFNNNLLLLNKRNLISSQLNLLR